MMKRAHCSLLLLIMMTAASGRLDASSMLSGGMLTVGPYGPQDAARNPALLSFQPCNNALGLSGNYLLSPYSDIDLKEFKPSLVNVAQDALTGGSGRISYARNINRFIIGFDYNVNIQTLTTRQNMYSVKGAFVAGQGLSQDKTMAHLFTTALSISLASSHAIGLRLNCSYINNKKTDTAQLIQASLPSVYVRAFEETDSEQLSMIPSVGYSAKFGISEIGVMLTTGRFTWRKTVMNGMIYDLSAIMAQLLFKGKGSLPFVHSYTVGPSLTAGFRIRPSFGTGAGIEIGVSLPVAYREQFLIRGDAFPSSFARLNYFPSNLFGLKNRVAIKPSFTVRGGLEFIVSRSILFNLGAGFGYDTPLTSSSGLTPAPVDIFFSEYSIRSALGSAGFDFLVGKNSTITIGSTAIYQFTSQNQSIKKSLRIFGKELKTKTLSLEMSASASIGF